MEIIKSFVWIKLSRYINKSRNYEHATKKEFHISHTFAIVMAGVDQSARLVGVDERSPKSSGDTKYIFFIIHSYLHCCCTPIKSMTIYRLSTFIDCNFCLSALPINLSDRLGTYEKLMIRWKELMFHFML